ncbi:MAG TPA: hypothetical protein DIW44_13650 [Anaerolineaceae bacterium]|nr:hypothetical protein [Anaerolineaceae bacterium]
MTDALENTIKSITGTEISGSRVHVVVDLEEKHTKPNLAMVLNDVLGNEVSRSLIMGMLDPHVEFTLHVRVPDAKPPLSLTGITFIEEDQPIDSKSVNVARLA